MNRYQLMFDQYVKELGEARDAATAWWQRLLDAEAARGATPEQAEERVRRRWTMGPTSHPRVLAVYRKYYIDCEELNRLVAAEDARRNEEAEQRGEGDWGVDDPEPPAESPDDWGPEWQIDPPAFLVDTLFGRRDDLGEFMGFMVFAPIGEEDDRSV